MTTLPLFQQTQAPPLACLESIVDLRPELPEILSSRKQGKDDYETQRDAAEGMNDGVRNTAGHLHSQNQQGNGCNLRHHLKLTEIGSVDRETLRRRNAAQAGDGELAADDDDHDPGGNDLQLNERDKG